LEIARAARSKADVLLDELDEAVVDGTRYEFMEKLTTVPGLIVERHAQAAAHRG
jgi:hypothetical protein